MRRFGLVLEPTLRDPVHQVLCGPFLGRGSSAMVASIRIPSCGITGGWAVFRHDAGSWRLVLKRDNGAQLAAAGSGIRETMSVLRPGDAHCFPTGGTRSRVWHWNGSRFTVSAWKLTPQGQSRGVLHERYFKLPSGNISCGLGDTDAAHCTTWDPPQSVHMTYDGKISICTGARRCSGPCGPVNRPAGCCPDTAVVLAYGRRDEFAQVRCESAETGVTCTLMRGPARGQGFRVSREGITRVG